jgi:hypothetical protein
MCLQEFELLPAKIGFQFVLDSNCCNTTISILNWGGVLDGTIEEVQYRTDQADKSWEHTVFFMTSNPSLKKPN